MATGKAGNVTPERDLLRSVRAEFEAFDVGQMLMLIVASVPYALGWLVGFIVRLVLWVVAAIVAGYKAGMGTGDK